MALESSPVEGTRHWLPPRAPESRDAVPQSFVPGRQVEGGERASTPTAQGAQTYSEECSRRTLRYPHPARAPPDERGSIAPSASRPLGRSFSAAHGGCCSRAARLCAGPVACSRRPRSRAPGLGPVGDGRREPEPGPVNPGGKQKPGKDEQARPASPTQVGARRDGERLPRPPGSAPPRGSTGPSYGRGTEGPGSGAGSLRRAGLEASRAPLARTHRSRTGELREGAGRWRGSGWTAKEEIRIPRRHDRPPDPCGHEAGTCRCGCS